jgi:hypothetical protein
VGGNFFWTQSFDHAAIGVKPVKQSQSDHSKGRANASNRATAGVCNGIARPARYSLFKSAWFT